VNAVEVGSDHCIGMELALPARGDNEGMFQACVTKRMKDKDRKQSGRWQITPCWIRGCMRLNLPMEL
jgi:hypothetical protein